MRRILWLAAIALAVNAFRRYRARSAYGQAQDAAAKATWDNEGGAPSPAEA
jgi:hypothetical protein